MPVVAFSTIENVKKIQNNINYFHRTLLMANLDDHARRENGVFYTPPELALRLVEPFANGSAPTSILDPACGSGSLLFAAQNLLKVLHSVMLLISPRINQSKAFHGPNEFDPVL